MKLRVAASGILALAFVLVMSVGCTQSGNVLNGKNGFNNKEYNRVTENGKFDPGVTITTARVVGPDYVFVNGEDIHDNVHNRWAQDQLGIEIKDLWNTRDSSSYHTKLRLSLATDDQLPDVFIVQDRGLIADFIQSGRVQDIQEAMDQYASERIKKLYEKYSDTMNQVRIDGKLMGLPVLTSGEGSSSVLWIRQDWLDRLHLKAPENMEQFEAVMEAFTNEDPDGNHKKDTFGFTFSARNGFSNWMSDASFIFGAMTGKAIPGIWQEDQAGRLRYGSVQPGIKDALSILNQWFAKGYLDPKIAALSETEAAGSFVNGKAGMIAAPYWALDWPLKELMKAHPGAEVVAYPLPAGPEGKSARYTGTVNENKVVLFNKDFKHMDAFFYYLDKIYDREYETGDFKFGYFEGYDYSFNEEGRLVNGSNRFDRNPTVGKYTLFWNSPEIPHLETRDIDYIYSGNKPQTVAQMRSSLLDQETLRAGSVSYHLNFSNVSNVFLGAPTKTMRQVGDLLTDIELETFVKIIYGTVPLDHFDRFISEWQRQGGMLIEQEVNDWYVNVKQ